jgi:ribosomal protein S18 acetylase RimI-like enzyme
VTKAADHPEGHVVIRDATSADHAQLRAAWVELQEYERGLHATRLPGEAVVDVYLEWMMKQASRQGAVLVALWEGDFAGFAAGWVEEDESLAESADSNRFGLISDVSVLPSFRGRRIAAKLLEAMQERLAREGASRIRICALAANVSARASYERAGFSPYEVVYEKRAGATAGSGS